MERLNASVVNWWMELGALVKVENATEHLTRFVK